MTSDGIKKYLAPSQTTNMWCSTQVDMSNFASWCYRAPADYINPKMEVLKERIHETYDE